MTPIGVYDAKTQLPKLLDHVGRGERFRITKHGRPVVQLVPAAAKRAEGVKKNIRHGGMAAMARADPGPGPKRL
jgi:prevent-host-death family protein